MKKTIWITGLLVVSSSALANEAHHDMSGHQVRQHAKHEQMRMNHNQDKMFLVKKQVDGYGVTFHVMPTTKEMNGGSHHLMVKIEKDGKALSDVMINSKVFFPDKTTDSKMLTRMGDWYMAGYDLGEGKHGIMILFKTSDGNKHQASIYYTKGE